MTTRVLHREAYEVHVLLDHRGQSQVTECLAAAQSVEQERFLSVVRRLGRSGLEQLPQYDLVDARNKIWKVHILKHIRVYCFKDGNRIILANAERKNRRRDDPHSLPRAVELRRSYLTEKGN